MRPKRIGGGGYHKVPSEACDSKSRPLRMTTSNRRGWRADPCLSSPICPQDGSPVSARPGCSFVEERHDSRSWDVACFQSLDPKARIGKQIVNLAAQVAAPGQSEPQRVEKL